jgi:hypothetical protein
MDKSEKTFLAHLNSDDHIQYVIRSHMHIENKLNEFVDFYFPNPKALESDNVTFLHKVRLANAVNFVMDDELPALRYLNGIRNKIAHRLNFIIDNKVRDEFVSTLDQRTKKIFEIDRKKYPPEDYDDDVRAILAILWTLLDHRLTAMRREHHELEERCRKALNKPEDWKLSSG